MDQKNQLSSPAPPKTKSNVGLIILIVVIALIVILGVGGYFGWKYYFKGAIEKLVTSPSPSSSSKISPSPTASATPSPSASPSSSNLKSGVMPTNGYIFADSNKRLLNESELQPLTYWQLKVARNEIYARYGRPFVHKDLECYFATQSWYHLNKNFAESMLSAIDNKNINLIQTYEKQINSPLQSFDSGC